MDRLDPTDTIAAIASPPGPGLRGLIRLSGPEAIRVGSVGFRPDSDLLPPDRSRSQSGRLIVAGFRPPISASIVFWPGPRTYTGQPMAEVHTVGSPPILRLVLSHYLRQGARLAEPGEFTLRAFLSGRIDLTQSEAVLGVIEARTPAQLDAALKQLAGGLAGPITTARDALLDLLAHIEANLDFAEEPDVDPVGREILAGTLDATAAQIERLADRLQHRDRSEDRPRVVLVGPPNSGKSSLFNALVGDDHAIVSPVAGTTRDYLTAPCDCNGLVVELVDTAGDEAPRSSLEGRAQTHRAEQSGVADLRLVCLAPDLKGFPCGSIEPGTIRVWTKNDLAPAPVSDAISTSSRTGEGLPDLRRAIADAIHRQSSDFGAMASTSVRCRESLELAGVSLRDASDTLRSGGGDELVAVDLRQVIDDLGRVVGSVVTDDILDRIFSRFCIGK